jgi:hypothetical protein
MPLIHLSYDETVSESALRQATDALPEIVAEAVSCPEEPWTGPPAMGDIEIRCSPKGSLDIGELNCVVEVRTKLFASRESNKQERADLIRDRLSARVNLGQFGVWLILAEGAWSQT